MMQTLIYALLCGKSCLGRNGLKRLLKIPFSCKLLLHHSTFFVHTLSLQKNSLTIFMGNSTLWTFKLVYDRNETTKYVF